MKLSTAILKGYKANGGRQCVDVTLDEHGRMCVYGAWKQAVAGGPDVCSRDIVDKFMPLSKAFEEAWGVSPVRLNNNRDERGDTNEPFPWEHLYGMARAAGL